MINKFKNIVFAAAVIFMASCDNTEDYTLGDLTPPSNIKLTAQILWVKQTLHPMVTVLAMSIFYSKSKADNALSYRIDYDASDALSLVNLPKGTG
ncbi:MAG: hypothetical protein U0T36_02920 [Saprospiraceae bacterium]